MTTLDVEPNPKPLAKKPSVEEVHLRRNVHCNVYDRCLETAFRRGWCSWTCHLCGRYALIRAPRAADVLYGPIVNPCL